MTVSMCDKCSIKTNKEAWAKYPEMLDLCKMCESFQMAINNTIDEQAEKLGIVTSVTKRMRKKNNGHTR
jgi:NMD protein affecting ribosome stability and mRNA decay